MFDRKHDDYTNAKTVTHPFHNSTKIDVAEKCFLEVTNHLDNFATFDHNGDIK